MTLVYKAGFISVLTLSPEILHAASKVDEVYGQFGSATCVVTSGLDGIHSSPGSLHYKGQALDFRIWSIPPDQRHSLEAAIQNALGSDYDVVLESTHLHVEYDPPIKGEPV